MLSPQFIVHNYSCSGTSQPTLLLERAHALIHAATLPSAWSNVQNVVSVTAFRASARCVQYPPLNVLIHAAKSAAHSLREWGTPTGDDDDISTLDDLEDFISTDLSFLADVRPASQALSSVPAPPSPPPHELDLNPLHDAIPQPHIHPSFSSPPARPLKLVPYQKTQPLPVPPYTLPFAPAPYARSAWLIPVRGTFPWDHSTRAVMLSPSSSSLHDDVLPISASARPDQRNGVPPMTVAWTRASLAAFWAFLLDVREKRAARMIGLSFHASRPLDAQRSQLLDTPTTAELCGNGRTPALRVLTPAPGTSATTAAASAPAPAYRVALSGVDHIKVYHDAENAMHLRNLFHLWSYVMPSAGSQAPKKIRVLRGTVVRAALHLCQAAFLLLVRAAARWSAKSLSCSWAGSRET
ncbi:hypothetical protein LshimejAT787_0703050 [Lyophyllum shimeji]|uniref:Uncharacterized protein n=1 Tax=Lyophyllum shimeji TaxID=47721 RepID=A0A9P3PNP9_LYOSH|nr:hypothetical protein LshimejAT787_0703050 [Lyophyllum shimeji]